ncbi:hypothetical protein [Streptomyces sp. NPDC056144]|uniref:hypothetical protein n=1 Tax=unclassified Streptomyces TaxID=2593676 RepID=UPI0035DCB57E
MYGQPDGWTRDGFESHEGTVGVLLADGSEPEPVVFDLGSGATFHESTFWGHYDGLFRRPKATSMRGRCACGWRGAPTYAIDWQEALKNDDPDAYDTTGPYADWEAHLEVVASRAVALPEDLAGLLKQVRERLERLWDAEDTTRAYATMLKACRELEVIAVEAGPEAVRALENEESESTRAIAQALGMTNEAAQTLIGRYRRLTWT